MRARLLDGNPGRVPQTLPPSLRPRARGNGGRAGRHRFVHLCARLRQRQAGLWSRRDVSQGVRLRHQRQQVLEDRRDARRRDRRQRGGAPGTGGARMDAGSDVPTSNDPRTGFVGTWTFTGGMLNGTCSDGSVVQRPLTSTDYMLITLGTTASTVLAQYYCQAGWTLQLSSGNTMAVATSNQTCIQRTTDNTVNPPITTSYTWSAVTSRSRRPGQHRHVDRPPDGPLRGERQHQRDLRPLVHRPADQELSAAEPRTAQKTRGKKRRNAWNRRGLSRIKVGHAWQG